MKAWSQCGAFRILRLVMWPTVVGLVSALHAEPPATALGFAGHFQLGAESRFLLRTSEGQESRWLTLGETWQNVTLIDFDVAKETLSVRIEDRIVVLALPTGFRPRPHVTLPESLLKLGPAEDYVVHPAGTQIQLPNGIIAFSARGLLVSNRAHTIVAGDLVLQRGTRVTEIGNVILQFRDQSMAVRRLDPDSQPRVDIRPAPP